MAAVSRPKKDEEIQREREREREREITAKNHSEEVKRISSRFVVISDRE